MSNDSNEVRLYVPATGAHYAAVAEDHGPPHEALGLQDVVVADLECGGAAAHLEDIVVSDDHDGDDAGVAGGVGVPGVDDDGLLLDEVVLAYDDGAGLGDDGGLGVDDGARADRRLFGLFWF